jgi:predicted nuclease of predicted toxin-antitoxin system
VRFLADMGISRTTVQWLRSGGHDAAHVAELGMKSAPDADVLALASREQRVVLTFDLDFGHILAASHDRAPSVIIFRVSNARPERVNAHLESVLRDTAVALDEGAIIIVEDERRRVRRLPIDV